MKVEKNKLGQFSNACDKVRLTGFVQNEAWNQGENYLHARQRDYREVLLFFRPQTSILKSSKEVMKML